MESFMEARFWHWKKKHVERERERARDVEECEGEAKEDCSGVVFHVNVSLYLCDYYNTLLE